MAYQVADFQMEFEVNNVQVSVIWQSGEEMTALIPVDIFEQFTPYGPDTEGMGVILIAVDGRMMTTSMEVMTEAARLEVVVFVPMQALMNAIPEPIAGNGAEVIDPFAFANELFDFDAAAAETDEAEIDNLFAEDDGSIDEPDNGFGPPHNPLAEPEMPAIEAPFPVVAADNDANEAPAVAPLEDHSTNPIYRESFPAADVANLTEFDWKVMKWYFKPSTRCNIAGRDRTRDWMNNRAGHPEDQLRDVRLQRKPKVDVSRGLVERLGGETRAAVEAKLTAKRDQDVAFQRRHRTLEAEVNAASGADTGDNSSDDAEGETDSEYDPNY